MIKNIKMNMQLKIYNTSVNVFEDEQFNNACKPSNYDLNFLIEKYCSQTVHKEPILL